MSIPNYQEIMLPLLIIAGDANSHNISEAFNRLADEFELSLEERDLLLPSGKQRIFQNRVHWAKFYLSKAGLIFSPKRGIFEITQRGEETLKDNPALLNNDYLRKFPEFIEFIKGSTVSYKNEQKGNSLLSTPEERLEDSFSEIIESLADELLNKVKSSSPSFFEQLVIELIVKMGYGGSRKDAGLAIGKSHDGGIDGIIKEDKLGLDVIYIQAKRWENTVGRPVVQAFAGSLDGVRAKRGILITTSKFSKEASEYVDNIEKSVVLINGMLLAKLMIEYNVGVTPTIKYELKNIDNDYFDDE